MSDKMGKKYYAKQHGGMGGFWFIGFIGAAVYYIQQAPDFWGGVLGVIKALFWPGVLVYQVFKLLHM